LLNKPFWIWNVEEHKKEDIKTNGECCFNHIIGLPIKGRTEQNHEGNYSKTTGDISRTGDIIPPAELGAIYLLNLI
jgi:hypothetical protein